MTGPSTTSPPVPSARWLAVLQWGSRCWGRVACAILLLIYVVLRLQIALYDRRIRAGEAELARLRPLVVEAVQATELDATVKAQAWFLDALEASAVAWEPVFQRLAAALPPTLVVNTMAVEGARMTLHGVLRAPPAEPEPYLAALAAALKRQGVFRAVTVALAPREVDDPSLVRVDVVGELH